MSNADLPDVLKYWEKKNKILQQYMSAVAKAEAEPAHLEALMLREKEMAEDDEIPISDGELAKTMEAHKTNSPFALDVAAARAKLMEAMLK